ncbi:MAG TPA: hypothetical protein VL178_00265 [Pseudomonas sp.]|jgi:hypothetical protein|nr:hypothetical protein [Pseudomonas sp.]
MPLALLFLVALAALPAQAAPAPWYVWESPTSTQRVCAQTRPGAAWRKVDGPYRNAACRAAPYLAR